MPHQIIKGNITKYKGDAIVNSLGVYGEIKGKLCQSILKASNSKELEKFLESKVINTVGSIYVTKAWNLPSKHIIHIVTPRRHEDDDDLTHLKKAYQDVIYNATQLGCKSIALPFIGIGENGYTESEAYTAVTEVCSKIADYEEKNNISIIDITIIIYIKKHRKNSFDALHEFNDIDFECRSACMSYPGELVSINDVDDENSIFHFANMMSKMYLNEYFEPDELYYIQSPWDFIEIYMKNKNINDKVFRGLLTKQRKLQFKKMTSFKKKYIYLFAFLLDFSPTVLLEFMIINGKSFSPIDSLDLFIKDYYFDDFYIDYDINNIYDFQQLIYDITGRDDIDFCKTK